MECEPDFESEEKKKNQDKINWLESENAYLRGMVEAYEKFLKDREYMKEEEELLDEVEK